MAFARVCWRWQKSNVMLIGPLNYLIHTGLGLGGVHHGHWVLGGDRPGGWVLGGVHLVQSELGRDRLDL